MDGPTCMTLVANSNGANDMEHVLAIDPELYDGLIRMTYLHRIRALLPESVPVTHHARRHAEMMHLTRPDGLVCLGAGQTALDAMKSLHAALTFAQSALPL